MVSLIQKSSLKLLLLGFGIVALLSSMLASMLLGIHIFDVHTLWLSITQFNGSQEHLVLRGVRIPAACIAAVVGANLAIAGALMQTLTKNPLASPSVFGINAGAVMFIVLSLSVFKVDLPFEQMIYIAFAGAAITAVMVITLGSAGKEGFMPVKLTLAGAAIAAFASSVTSGLMLLNNDSLTEALFWLVGAVYGREMSELLTVLPYMLVGWIIVAFMFRPLNVMAIGDDVAKGLGQRTMLTKIAIMVVVILLAGSSVALAGPIAFIGIIVPHICRYLIGNDHKWLIPFCAVAGALLLVSADTAARFLLMPKEVPVGVTTALLGVPFLIVIARRRTYE
ncbi:FecCD family ABC transporter permease [Paenibacillus taiwanensis]|uniref:FecCD family ABC transporter permease n=1 Tax=Paenibacillus taiwanensis TaxID=401638 RepID=UPI001FE16BBB|nr:iron ABC transporter permease [Paenibacillus taiwanensis]